MTNPDNINMFIQKYGAFYVDIFYVYFININNFQVKTYLNPELS